MHFNFNTLKITNPSPQILIVHLCRPKVRNAINSIMMHELRELWQALYIVNTEQFQCIILTGEAPAFCAGADLTERCHLTLDAWREQHAVFEQAMLAMLSCPMPIIAAVNGTAFGGGLELVLASDFAYAASTATFAQPEAKVGLMPGALGTQHLPRACGLQRAKELAFTGESFNAQEAYEWGIINKIYAPDELMQAVLITANKICENAPLSILQTKKALNISQQLDIKSGFAYEIEAYNLLLPTKDREEGIHAFNEKRKPKFIGK